MTPLPLLLDPTYQCPGEDYSISRAVHLSRLAAFYPKCRECPHRQEAETFSTEVRQRIETTQRRIERPTLFTETGVRGVYLNELTALKAGQLAGAFASLLWEEQPLKLSAPEAEANPLPRRRPGPKVVVGHDERPSSPDIVTGAAKILRRMGCQVVDVGLVTRACFWLAVDHLQAAGGIHVTGSGCAPAWTGMDFVGTQALPWTQHDRLRDLARRFDQGYTRPLRQGAGQRTFHPQALYEAGMDKHFHALRPLRVVCGCANRPVWNWLQKIFQKLACKLLPVSIPVRERDLHSVADADVRLIAQAVREQQAHFGLLIDDDGQSVAVLDEHGRLVLPDQLLRVLAADLLRETPRGVIVLETGPAEKLLPWLDRLDGLCLISPPGLAQMGRMLRESEAHLGGGTSGRFWFRESFPTCDAILTLAKLLQALSRSDADLSEVVASLS